MNTPLPEVGSIAIYKIRISGRDGLAIGLPKDVCLALGMAPGGPFLAVRQVGPCLVISRVTEAASAESRLSEADAQTAELVAAWQREKGPAGKSNTGWGK